MKAYTKAKLQPLIEKHQRTLTLDDVEAIVDLDKIAERIEKNAKQINEPDYFRIGSRIYRYPSFRVLEFIDKSEGHYITGHFSVISSLWALDCERKQSDFDKMPGVAKLLNYARKIDVSVNEVSRILNEKFKEEEPKKDADGNVVQPDPIDPWYICALLTREIGGSPDEWFNATPAKLDSAIKAVDEKVEAEMNASGKSSPPKPTPTLRAVSEFRKHLNALESTWLAE